MPERRSLRRELRCSFYRRLWNSSQASPSTLDGVVRCVPETSAPGPLTQHTGLYRPQQLVVYSTKNIPLVPFIFQGDGGLVRSPNPLVTNRLTNKLLVGELSSILQAVLECPAAAIEMFACGCENDVLSRVWTECCS